MQMHPYLFFNGDCADAMAFYKQVLGGSLSFFHFHEMPDFDKMFTPESKDRVAHACLECDGHMLMASDSCPQQPVKSMEGFSVSLTYEDTGQAEKIFNELSVGGDTFMPWEPTFWAEGFGMFKDKYGVAWMVSGRPLNT